MQSSGKVIVSLVVCPLLRTYQLGSLLVFFLERNVSS